MKWPSIAASLTVCFPVLVLGRNLGTTNFSWSLLRSHSLCVVIYDVAVVALSLVAGIMTPAARCSAQPMRRRGQMYRLPGSMNTRMLASMVLGLPTTPGPRPESALHINAGRVGFEATLSDPTLLLVFVEAMVSIGPQDHTIFPLFSLLASADLLVECGL